MFKHVLLRGVDVVMFYLFFFSHIFQSSPPCFSLTQYTAALTHLTKIQQDQCLQTLPADVTMKLQISSSRHFCHLFVMYLFIYLKVFSPRENIWNKISMRILLEKKTQAQKDRRGKKERVYAQHLLIVPNLINRIECVCD